MTYIDSISVLILKIVILPTGAQETRLMHVKIMLFQSSPHVNMSVTVLKS